MPSVYWVLENSDVYAGGYRWGQTMSEDPGHDWGGAANLGDLGFSILGEEVIPTGSIAVVNDFPCVRTAQTFTPASGGQVSSVSLLLARVGLPGTFEVSIRSIDITGEPSTNVLAKGTSNGDTLPEATYPYSSTSEWRAITFVTPVTLTGGVQYAIVLRLNPYAPVVVTDAATGVGGSPSVNAKGNIAVVETRIHYIGTDGNEYFILGVLAV